MHTAFTLRQGATLRFGERRPGRARASPSGADSTCRRVRQPRDQSRQPHGTVRRAGADRWRCPADWVERHARTDRSVAGDSVALPLPAGGARLRVMPGPQERCFTAGRTRRSLRRGTSSRRVQSHGIPARRPAARARRRRRHPVRRDADRVAAGAGLGSADSADGRSTDDRRLSEDRHGDRRRSAARRAARARRLDRVRALHAATRPSTRSGSGIGRCTGGRSDGRDRAASSGGLRRGPRPARRAARAR